MKKILLGVAGMVCGLALVFSIAAPAQAAALTSAQVQAIIGLLQSFGADASVVANVQATLTGQYGTETSPVNPPSLRRACPIFTRTLNQGVSGSDVADLQAYLGVSQTGYFGPMTAQAVASFQASEGLAQVGIVGPQTRAAFARRCGGGGTSNATFSASPTYGSAPLAVTFTITAEAGEYSVEFGDGQSAAVTLPAVQCFRAPCNTQTNVAHTYTSNGTYTAKLMYQPPYYCPPGAYCAMMMPAPKQVGAVTITVGGNTTGGVPSINGLDAPTSLSVGQTGTWTVRASAPSGTQLSYYVSWGDEGWGATTGSAQAAQSNVQTSASFSHAYQNAGTYSPTFYVSNDYGTVQTSASVVVSGNTQAATFSASPTSGAAPLAVQLSATNLGSDTSQYSVNFGDGTSGNGSCSPSPGLGACMANALFFNHTYTQAGTYYAKLIYQPPYYCPSGAYCTMMMPAPQTVGTVTITVTGATSNATFSASPTSGWAPLGVRFTATGLDSAYSYSVNFGDGTSGQGSCSITSTSVCTQGTLYFNHTYTANGTYTATLTYQYCPGGQIGACAAPQVVGTVTITVITGWL